MPDVKSSWTEWRTSVSLERSVESTCRAESRREAKGSANRNQAIELLRVVGAFGVVAFHAGTVSPAIPYAGLVVFLMLSPMIDMGMNLHRSRSGAALARGFLVPWAFWSIVYGILNVAMGKPPLPGPSLAGLFYGSGVHLWFLPFMAGMLVLLDEAKRIIPAKPFFYVSLVALFALLISFSFWRPVDVSLPPPVAQWVHALPPVIAGIVAGLAVTSVRRRIVTSLVIAPALGYLVLSGADRTYALGMVATAAIGWSGGKVIPVRWDVRGLSSCMFGVYLTHMIWLTILRRLIEHQGYVLVITAFMASFVSVWLARRFLPEGGIVLG